MDRQEKGFDNSILPAWGLRKMKWRKEKEMKGVLKTHLANLCLGVLKPVSFLQKKKKKHGEDG